MPEEKTQDATVIARALHEVMMEVTGVAKTGQNDFQHYAYMSETDLLLALRPSFLKVGLLMIPVSNQIIRNSETDIPDASGNVYTRTTYLLIHKDTGARMEIESTNMGNDRAKSGLWGDKGISIANTSSLKSMLRQLLLLPTGADSEAPKSVYEIDLGDIDDIEELPTMEEIFDDVRGLEDIGLEPAGSNTETIAHDQISDALLEETVEFLDAVNPVTSEPEVKPPPVEDDQWESNLVENMIGQLAASKTYAAAMIIAKKYAPEIEKLGTQMKDELRAYTKERLAQLKRGE